MMSCREVALLLSTGGVDDAPLIRRLAVRMHLAMCSRCAAFRRQLERMTVAARAAAQAVESQMPSSLSQGIQRRLATRRTL